jgi:uncharacterized DUF497 family protein
MLMSYEWDDNKNAINLAKHGVSFEDARRAFEDPQRIILEDRKHTTSSEERRYCIGHDGRGILTVRYTIRDGNIRIFGAGYWREGKRHYEQ